MSSLCVIPAREGSKRIPHKNTKSFLGKPILEHVIEIVKTSGIFDTIVVSTDDFRAAGIAVKHEISTLKRPAKLADDYATTAEVLEHALWMFDGYDQACCVYPTSVFLTAEILAEGKTHLPRPSFAAVKYPASIERAFTADWRMMWPDKRDSRTQDLQEHYYDAGLFYWVDTERFLREPSLLNGRSIGVVPSLPSWDINTPEDWRMAEAIYGAFYDRPTGDVEG